jgi:hypothetical protein
VQALIYPAGHLPGKYASPTIRGMIDINEIRHRNVRALVRRLEEDAGRTGERAGGLAMLAEKMGKSSAQVSHFAADDPIKNIGDKIAREIEVTFGLEYGWMDWPNWTDETAAPPHSQLVRLDPVMLSQTYKTLLSMEPEADHPLSLANPADAAHFVQVYEMRAAMPVEPSQEEWVEFGRKLAMLTPTGGDDGRGGGAVPVEGAGKGKMARKVRREA